MTPRTQGLCWTSLLIAGALGASACLGGGSGGSGGSAASGGTGTGGSGPEAGIGGSAGTGVGPSCGSVSQPCCNGATCGAGLACRPSTRTCEQTACETDSDCATATCAVGPVGGTDAGCAFDAGTSQCTTKCVSGRCLYRLFSGVPDDIAVDATSVYFTSTQGLTTQGLSLMKMPVSGGAPTTLASAGDGGSPSGCGIALQSTNVYWNECNKITTVPVSGGTVTTLALGEADAMAVNSKNVYWSDGQDLLEVPLAGGLPSTLVSNARGFAMAANSAALFWTDDTDGVVMKLQLAGGTPITLAGGQSENTASSPEAIAIDSTNVYWTDAGDGTTGTVMKEPIGGGVATTLASGQDDLGAAFQPGGGNRRMAVDSTSVYWTGDMQTDASDANGTVVKVPTAGGTPTTLFSGPETGSIAVDSTSVYWVESIPSSGCMDPVGSAIMKLTPE